MTLAVVTQGQSNTVVCIHMRERACVCGVCRCGVYMCGVWCVSFVLCGEW